jgi:predicted nuclease of predicted toxin-antitoxin system
VNFLVDAQLPPALARWIVSRGHQASHVFDLGFHAADDPVIWARANSEQATIISKDEDFVDHWLLSDQPVSLVWVRKGNCSTRTLLSWFEPLWTDILNRLVRGEKFIELRA